MIIWSKHWTITFLGVITLLLPVVINIIKYLFLICAVFDHSLYCIHSPQISNYLLIKSNQVA